jgi:hypothetical protein
MGPVLDEVVGPDVVRLFRRRSGSVSAPPASAVGANWNASRAIRSRRRWAETGVRDGSRRMARRSWPCWRRPRTSRWRNCVASWPTRVWSSATARSAASSSATRSRAKKDRARHRTRPARHSEATRAVVRGSARPRPGAAGLYRRDLGLDQHGAPLRALPARRAAQGRHPAWALEDHSLRRRPHHARLHCPMGARWANQPRRLRGLCRQGAHSGTAAWRHRDHGQPLQPQRAGGARDDRSSRRRVALPPALQPRLQPHRGGLLEAEGIAAQNGRANHRRSMGHHRQPSRSLQAGGMPQLFQCRRI